MTTEATKRRQPYLDTFLNRLEGSDYLPTGYAYLIRSSVRMPELYPFLGEWLFTTRCSMGIAPNIVGMFVDDSPDTLIRNLIKVPKRMSFWSRFSEWAEGREFVRLPQVAYWMDTYGRFQDTGELQRIEDIAAPRRWFEKHVAGSGNPMSMFRFIREAHESAVVNGSDGRHAPGRPEDDGSAQNGKAPTIYLLNSLSNLHRNLGLRETAALLRSLLVESIWSSETSAFLAVLQDGVMGRDDVRYLESFFDGIIHLTPEPVGQFRFVKMVCAVLPSQDKLRRLPKPVLYKQKWRRGERPQLAQQLKLDISYLPEHAFLDVFPLPLHITPAIPEELATDGN